MYRISSLLAFCVLLLSSCQNEGGMSSYKLGKADNQSVQLVDKYWETLGGKSTFDEIKYVSFVVNNHRKWDVDLKKQRYKLEIQNPKIVITGKFGDQSSISAQSVPPGKYSAAVEQYARAVEDFYQKDIFEVLMPFYLRHQDISLNYIGKDTTSTKNPSEIIEATFSESSKIHNGKMNLYFNPATHLLVKTSIPTTNKLGQKRMRQTKWENYEKLSCNLTLPTKRGKDEFQQIKCATSIPAKVFEN